MAAQSAFEPASVTRPPAVAWDWLQRSRPLVERLAEVLTGRPPGAGFVQAVRRSYPDDPLVRDAVREVIASTAFRGRVPRTRPPGAVWDRGLVWWAADIVGSTIADYEADPVPVDQPALFAVDSADRSPADERTTLAAALRELLARSDGQSVPAAEIRHLLAQLTRQAR